MRKQVALFLEFTKVEFWFLTQDSMLAMLLLYLLGFAVHLLSPSITHNPLNGLITQVMPAIVCYALQAILSSLPQAFPSLLLFLLFLLPFPLHLSPLPLFPSFLLLFLHHL